MATRKNESSVSQSYLMSHSVVYSIFTLATSCKPSDSRATIFYLQTERTPTEPTGGGEREREASGEKLGC